MSEARHEDGRTGEFELIARYFAPLASKEGAFGLLDDAAMLRVSPGEDLVLTKDSLAAGVHFFADDRPDYIARKALRVNLSDLAAKGAEPRAYLLSLALPGDWSEQWLEAFAKGLAEDQKRYKIDLYGGDTLKSPDGLVISVTAIGSVPTDGMVTRLGGKTGDALYVSGTIGDAALGLSVHGDVATTADWPLSEDHRRHLSERYLLPQPRLELAPSVRAYANAAMDISDGLLGDLAKLCRASGLGGIVNVDDVPHSDPVCAMIGHGPKFRSIALNGGDDYEILCSVPRDHTNRFEAEARSVGIAVTQIGELTKFAHGVSVIDNGGETLPVPGSSFEHF